MSVCVAATAGMLCRVMLPLDAHTRRVVRADFDRLTPQLR